MPKINDFNRLYWRNADSSREFPDDEDELEQVKDEHDIDEAVCSLHINDRGETVGYRLAPEDSETKYEVVLDGEVVEDVTLDGEYHDEAHFEELRVDTRGEAREAASDLMRSLPPIDEEKLAVHGPVDEDDEEAPEPYDYDTLQEFAKPRGIPANQSRDELAETLSSG